MAAGVRRLSRPRTVPSPEFGPIHLKTANEFISKRPLALPEAFFFFPYPQCGNPFAVVALPDFFERPIQKLPTLSFFYK